MSSTMKGVYRQFLKLNARLVISDNKRYIKYGSNSLYEMPSKRFEFEEDEINLKYGIYKWMGW